MIFCIKKLLECYKALVKRLFIHKYSLSVFRLMGCKVKGSPAEAEEPVNVFVASSWEPSNHP